MKTAEQREILQPNNAQIVMWQLRSVWYTHGNVRQEAAMSSSIPIMGAMFERAFSLTLSVLLFAAISGCSKGERWLGTVYPD